MERLEEAVKEWTISHNNDEKDYVFQRKDNSIHFTVQTRDDGPAESVIKFNINCPNQNDEEGPDQWSVWSDHEKLQTHIGSILEFCYSPRSKTISEILDRFDKAIDKILDTEIEVANEDDDEYDVDDNYYDGDDIEDDVKAEATRQHSDDDEGSERFFGAGASPAAFQRLMKDLKNMKKESDKFGFNGEPRGDNLFLWDVKLTGIPKDTILGKDILKWAEKHKREPAIYIEMQFPGEYPMAPPFVRVIRPRFKFLTGHVTIGGSICMEMLTRSGWTPSNDIEGILVQIRAEILSDPNARLASNPDEPYGEAEARDAFNRMLRTYGWN